MDYKEKIEIRIATLKEELARYVAIVKEAEKRIPMYQSAIGELENILVIENTAKTEESPVG